MAHGSQTVDTLADKYAGMTLAQAIEQGADIEELAANLPPLSAEANARVDGYLAQVLPLSDAEVAAEMRIPVDMVPQFRQIMTGGAQ